MINPRFLLMLFSLLLYACETKTKTEDIVMGKWHQPGSVGYTLMPTYDPFTGTSSSSLQPVYFKESWNVKIERGDTIEVSKTMFDTLDIGDVLLIR